MRRATSGYLDTRRPCAISIHALLAESDAKISESQYTQTFYFYPRSPCGERRSARPDTRRPCAISIHALLAESDSKPRRLKSRRCVFLSTLSLRRATIIRQHSTPDNGNFYPRSPCGERLKVTSAPGRADNFYPRSPCGERLDAAWRKNNGKVFLSTLSLRRATPLCCCGFSAGRISIHALLAESDAVQIVIVVVHALFLSTLSLRRATSDTAPHI